MAQLSTVLEHHSRYQPTESLQNSLGDGYLITNNSIYRRVREFVYSQHIEFTTKLTPAVLALPLGQLENFLKTKTIYYCDNVSVLKNIELGSPNQISWESLVSHLKRNMIFHESCHFLARHHFAKLNCDELNRDKQKTSVLQIILEESFANACELLGAKDVRDNIHRNFYEINSYIFLVEHKSLMRNLIDHLGFEIVFQWAMLSYVFSNFLHETLTEKDFHRIANYVGLPSNLEASVTKQLKVLSRLSFELNPDFKYSTTAFYLKHLGHRNGLQELREVDCMNEIVRYTQIKDVIKALSHAVQ